jgi:hypothetical protein
MSRVELGSPVLREPSSARAALRKWGDRGDSNPLVTRSTTWRIDRFCFGHSPPSGNRTPSRLLVRQLLAIELRAAKRGNSTVRARTVQIKGTRPLGRYFQESCGTDLNRRPTRYQRVAPTRLSYRRMVADWSRTGCSSASPSRDCRWLAISPREIRSGSQESNLVHTVPNRRCLPSHPIPLVVLCGVEPSRFPAAQFQNWLSPHRDASVGREGVEPPKPKRLVYSELTSPLVTPPLREGWRLLAMRSIEMSRSKRCHGGAQDKQYAGVQRIELGGPMCRDLSATSASLP